MQIKMKWNTITHPLEKIKFKRLSISSIGKMWKNWNSHFWWEYKMYNHLENSLAVSFKHKFTTWPSHSSQEKNKQNKNTCTKVFIEDLFLIAPAGNKPKFINRLTG